MNLLSAPNLNYQRENRSRSITDNFGSPEETGFSTNMAKKSKPSFFNSPEDYSEPPRGSGTLNLNGL
jgi:hypothetical protein